jgi:hypothetical protein
MVKIKKIKIKKKIKICFILFLLFFLFLIWYIPKNYEVKYLVNDIEVKENYNKDENTYSILFTYDNKEYFIKIESKYYHKRKLVSNIEVSNDDNTICLIPSSNKLDLYPLCYQDDSLISYQLITNKDLINSKYFNEITGINDKYKNITINYLNNKKYYIWNYKGFYVIDSLNKEELNLFDTDTYSINLIANIGSNILIADYNSKYNFKKFYLVNSKNNKVKEITNNSDISFDSYIMGSYKNKLYLFDKTNKIEYEINTKKLSINNINSKNKGRIINNNEWEYISLNKLSNNEYKFSTNNLYDYEIIDNKLYLVLDEFKTLVSNKEVKDIVYIDNDTVYYLVDDKLYYYNHRDGEILIMEYFEWNFNYENMIYIF